MFTLWKILLVEDDEDDYLLVKSMLSEAKGARHKLRWAHSYQEAVQLLTAENWDAVLVDYDLGVQTGLDLIGAVASISSRIPVILLTGRGSYETDIEAMYAGAADYLTKAEANGVLLERTIRYSIERKQVEEELRQAKEELEERVRERTQELEKLYRELNAAEKHMAMSRMIASVAHELNNPIQTIENCLFLLQEDLKPEARTSEVMNMALSESRRIATLVNQLREIYRPSKVGPMQPVQVTELLNEVHSLLLPHLQHKNVNWQMTVSGENPQVNAISDQLKQVFLNISLNAIEAMEPDGGNLGVEVCADRQIKRVIVSFTDTGPGIAVDDIRRLFEPFFTTKEKGNGLGLAICYDIIQRHNGQIEVESKPGAGAMFRISLPQADLSS